MKSILCLRGQEFSCDDHVFQVIFTNMWFLQTRCGLLFTIINHNHNQEYLHNQTRRMLSVKRKLKFSSASMAPLSVGSALEVFQRVQLLEAWIITGR